jgi:hypothetical protein
MAFQINDDDAGVAVPRSAIMSVWEVLSWIAFNKIRPRGDFGDAADFTLRWGHSNAGPVLEALEGRAAPAPFCVVQPVVADDVSWDGEAYAHRTSSPDSPRMLRWIRAMARQREARLVTYAVRTLDTGAPDLRDSAAWTIWAGVTAPIFMCGFGFRRGRKMIALRACTCSFCRGHSTRMVSDPQGVFQVWADDWSLVELSVRNPHRDFRICRRCGIFIAAVSEATMGARRS